MYDTYIGTIMLFGGNYAPVNWMYCNGQILQISQYQALFAVIGTTYGGNGVSTFALPDLRGRLPIHPGTGPGLTTRILGVPGGEERVTLTEGQIPSHNHVVASVLHASEEANTEDPSNNYIAASSVPAFSNSEDLTLNAGSITNTVSNTGQSQSHDNMPPFLGVNYIICVQGLYPSRT